MQSDRVVSRIWAFFNESHLLASSYISSTSRVSLKTHIGKILPLSDLLKVPKCHLLAGGEGEKLTDVKAADLYFSGVKTLKSSHRGTAL